MVKHLTSINEIRLHYKRPHISKLPQIDTISQAVQNLRTIIEPGILDLKEYYWIILLTADNRLLGVSEINSGTVVGIKFFAREIMQLALLSNAVNIVLVHNHPSGDLSASTEDIESTKNIGRIGKTMDVHLLDHLIITSESFASIRSVMDWKF